MTMYRSALSWAFRRLATCVAGAALVAACSNANPSPSVTASPQPTMAATQPAAAPSVVPTSAPTAAPSVAAEPPQLNAGSAAACDPSDTGEHCFAPGTYQLNEPRDWPVTVTVEVPAGWFEPGVAGPGWDLLLVTDGPPDYAGSGWGVMFTTVGDVYRDPCDVSKGTIPAAQVDTPQKLAAAITAWPGFTTTAAQPITVDGHRALELKTAKKAKSGGCAAGNAWLSSSGTSVDAYPFAAGSAYPTTIRIVDTGRGLLVIRASDFPNTSPFEIDPNGLANTPDRHAGDQAALHAILDSIHLGEPAPGSSPAG